MGNRDHLAHSGQRPLNQALAVGDSSSADQTRNRRGGQLWDLRCSLRRHAPPTLERHKERLRRKAGRMKRAITITGLALSLLIGVSGSLILFPHTAGARTAHAPTSHRLAGHARVRALHVSAAAVARRVGERAHALRQTGQQRRYRTGPGQTQRLSRGSGAGRYSAASASTATGATRYARYGTLTRTGQYGSMARYSAGRTGRSCPHMTTSATRR